MKISKNLPQFEKEKVLIVVTGNQEAKFFTANKGEINELEFFKFEKLDYPDKEGSFLKRGKEGVYKRGAVYEPKKQKMLAKLTSKLKERLKNILKENKIDSIYFSSPSHLKNEIQNSFPVAEEKKIKAYLGGDYCHLKPFDILERIKKTEKTPIVLTKESAVKILKKAKEARRVIKGRP